jgi:hypothetical protein
MRRDGQEFLEQFARLPAESFEARFIVDEANLAW